MDLSELMRGAQQAMDRGEYQVASRACTHALEAYPSCLTAHRVLGEAHLERGQADLATQHFDRALEIDPLNVVARLGLGVASEERQDPSTAYMHYLNAWETNPALEQVRDELLRLRHALGREDRLHPTRAGLASIYSRSGQLGRAASEWRALLHADPDNIRSRSALAEVLWRSGDDLGAATAAAEALELAPQNARLLAILADIEYRRGSNNADALAARYLEADPLGDVLTTLAELRPSSDFGILQSGPLPVEPFDFASVQAAFAEARMAAPGALSASHLLAPDLWDNLVRDFTSDPSGMGDEPVGEVVPFAWTEEAAAEQEPEGSILGDSVLPAPEPVPAAPEEDALIPAANLPDAQPNDPLEQPDLNQLYGELLAQEQPAVAAAPELFDPLAAMAFDLDVSAGAEAPAAPEPFDALASMAFDLDVSSGAEAPAVLDSFDSMVGTAFDIDMTVPPESLDFADPFAAMAAPDDLAAVMAVQPPTAAMTPDEIDFAVAFNDVAHAMAAPAPVDEVVGTQESAPDPAANPFITADGRVDLTVGWDELDQTLAEATPSGDDTAGFEHLLAEIDAGGIAPFAAAEPAGDDEAWEPFTDDDVQPVAAALEPDPVAVSPPASSAAAPEIDFSDDAVWGIQSDPHGTPFSGSLQISSYFSDEIVVPVEVAAGLPEPSPHGYTEIFRNLDQDTPQDFASEEPPIDPLASPDLAGDPPDLVEVLAADAGGGDTLLDLGSIDVDAMTPDQWLGGAGIEAAVEAPVAAAVASAATGFDAALSDLHGIEPFTFDEHGGSDGDGEASVDFSDVNEAPFDPAQYSAMPDLAALHDPTRQAISPVAEDIPLESLIDEPDIDLGALADTTIEVAAESDDDIVAIAAEVVKEHAARSWPAFVGMTSELIDRSQAGLFERLRSEKSALIEAGLVAVQVAGHVQPEVLSPPAIAEAPAEPVLISPAPTPPVVEAKAAPDHGLNLVMLRERLLESEEAARAVAEQLEAAVSRGTSDAALLRALGEAYLKLGMSEQAAAQFRRAMLTRRQAR